jgi:hypothetical protein
MSVDLSSLFRKKAVWLTLGVVVIGVTVLTVALLLIRQQQDIRNKAFNPALLEDQEIEGRIPEPREKRGISDKKKLAIDLGIDKDPRALLDCYDRPNCRLDISCVQNGVYFLDKNGDKVPDGIAWTGKATVPVSYVINNCPGMSDADMRKLGCSQNSTYSNTAGELNYIENFCGSQQLDAFIDGELLCYDGLYYDNSCGATPSPTPPPAACNQSCSSSANCTAGLTCSGGMCRKPECVGETDCICPVASPTPPPASCNQSCSTNAQCSSGLTCSGGMCRLPACLGETDCVCPVASPTPSPVADAGFQVVKFEDKNNNASFDSNESGLAWTFEWDLNGDNNWRSYVTTSSNGGMGARIGGLSGGDRVRVREVTQSGWTATTPTSREITVNQGDTVVVRFGNQRVAAQASTTTVVDSPASPKPIDQLPVAGTGTPSAVLIVAGAVVTILGIIGFMAL